MCMLVARYIVLSQVNACVPSPPDSKLMPQCAKHCAFTSIDCMGVLPFIFQSKKKLLDVALPMDFDICDVEKLLGKKNVFLFRKSLLLLRVGIGAGHTGSIDP